MCHALRQHGVYVVIGERVDNIFAVSLELHQMSLLQYAQLMRHCALGCANYFGDISHTARCAHKGVEDFDACCIGENFE